MDYKKLIVGSIIEKDRIIIGASFYEQDTIDWSRITSPAEIKNLFKNKDMSIIGNDLVTKCKIISISVTNSISDYKSVFFETDLPLNNHNIKENDLINII